MIPFLGVLAILGMLLSPATEPKPWRPEDCEEQMETLGWIIVLFAVVLPLVLVFA